MVSVALLLYLLFGLALSEYKSFQSSLCVASLCTFITVAHELYIWYFHYFQKA